MVSDSNIDIFLQYSQSTEFSVLALRAGTRCRFDFVKRSLFGVLESRSMKHVVYLDTINIESKEFVTSREACDFGESFAHTVTTYNVVLVRADETSVRYEHHLNGPKPSCN